jgi:O-acetyl-ADP-ribose deacetylase (regulator of RNase III)
MAKISYATGDALIPQIQAGDRYIVHCVNCRGIMGAGIAAQIKRRWPIVYTLYDALLRVKTPLEVLGTIQVVDIFPGLKVCNLFGQYDMGNTIVGDVTIPAVDYRAIHLGFAHLKKYIIDNGGGTIHMPRLGCGLAGGDWNHIEDILHQVFDNCDVEIMVYDFTPRF